MGALATISYRTHIHAKVGARGARADAASLAGTSRGSPRARRPPPSQPPGSLTTIPPPSPAARSLPAPRSFLPPRPRTDPQLAANARAIVENKGRDRRDLSRGDTRDEARARGQGSEALMTLLLELLLHAAHVPPYELFTGCGMSYDACHFFAMDSPTQGSLPFHYPIGNLNSFLVLRMCVVVGAARAAISSS